MGAVQCFDLNRPHHERVIGRLYHRLTTLQGAAKKDPLPAEASIFLIFGRYYLVSCDALSESPTERGIPYVYIYILFSEESGGSPSNLPHLEHLTRGNTVIDKTPHQAHPILFGLCYSILRLVRRARVES